MSELVVHARGLSKNFGSVQALRNVSLDIGAGQIVGLIGPNGAGKTTALKAVLGLTPFTGQLSVLGLDPHQWQCPLKHFRRQSGELHRVDEPERHRHLRDFQSRGVDNG